MHVYFGISAAGCAALSGIDSHGCSADRSARYDTNGKKLHSPTRAARFTFTFTSTTARQDGSRASTTSRSIVTAAFGAEWALCAAGSASAAVLSGRYAPDAHIAEPAAGRRKRPGVSTPSTHAGMQWAIRTRRAYRRTSGWRVAVRRATRAVLRSARRTPANRGSPLEEWQRTL